MRCSAAGARGPHAGSDSTLGGPQHMSVRTHYKLLGAAGAAALAIGTVAAPAVAAGEETADVHYTCTTALGLTPVPTAHYAVDAPPATMVAGQRVSLPTTGTITLDSTTTGAVVSGFHW